MRNQRGEPVSGEQQPCSVPKVPQASSYNQKKMANRSCTIVVAEYGSPRDAALVRQWAPPGCLVHVYSKKRGACRQLGPSGPAFVCEELPNVGRDVGAAVEPDSAPCRPPAAAAMPNPNAGTLTRTPRVASQQVGAFGGPSPGGRGRVPVAPSPSPNPTSLERTYCTSRATTRRYPTGCTSSRPCSRSAG